MSSLYRWATAALSLLLTAPLALAQEPVDTGLATAAADSPGMFRWIVLVLGIGLIAALAAVGRRYAATITLVAGLGLVFIGERLFGTDSLHWVLTGLGGVAVVASLGMRAQAMLSETHESRRTGQRLGLLTAGFAASSLALYAITLPQLGAPAEGSNLTTIALALTPIVVLCGLLPTLFLDRVLADNPVMLPVLAPRRAATAGLSTALALSLLFPLNYAANADKYEVEADYSYFRVTGVGTRTQGIVRTLSSPVTAYLFFDGGSDVRAKAEDYFRSLAGSSEGLLQVEVVDQAMRPDLAEQYGVRDNGWVVLATEDTDQKFEIGTEMSRAERKLTRLDSTVTKNLLRLVSDAKVVYFLSGHGEASWRERGRPDRDLSTFKRDLEDLNFDVQNFGITEGSAVDVPEDAAAVVIAAPLVPVISEEQRAIIRYLERGGSVLVLLDPGSAAPTAVLDFLQVDAGGAPIANANAFIRTRGGGLADRFIVGTNRFGSHTTTSTISRNSAQNPLGLPGVVSVTKKAEATHEITTLTRSYPDSWEDVVTNAEQDDSEASRVFDLAVAVEPDGGDSFRAVVIGDSGLFSEMFYGNLQANQDFAADIASWLVGEDELVGGTEREGDVAIVHSQDDDKSWFWGTILGVPLLILGLGGLFVSLRRRTS